MPRVRWILAFVIAWPAWFAPAQTTRPVTDSAPSRSFEAWIADLDADDFSQREAAMTTLAKAGETAREALEAARTTGSLERRLRVGELLARLSVRSPDAPDTRSGTRVSVSMIGKPLAEIVARLAEQGGTRIVLG